jgi:hypothetical protein
MSHFFINKIDLKCSTKRELTKQYTQILDTLKIGYILNNKQDWLIVMHSNLYKIIPNKILRTKAADKHNRLDIYCIQRKKLKYFYVNSITNITDNYVKDIFKNNKVLLKKTMTQRENIIEEDDFYVFKNNLFSLPEERMAESSQILQFYVSSDFKNLVCIDKSIIDLNHNRYESSIKKYFI